MKSRSIIFKNMEVKFRNIEEKYKEKYKLSALIKKNSENIEKRKKE